MRQYEPVVSGKDKLETSILGLEFRVKPKHFKRGDMKLKVGWVTFFGSILNTMKKFQV